VLGAFITLIFCLAMVGLGTTVFRRLLEPLDPLARWGVGGLFGLGSVGTLTLVLGFLPGGLRWGFWLVLGVGVVGLVLLARDLRREPRPAGPVGAEWFFVGAFGIAVLLTLVATLAPSTAMDWDSLAYHLAVPKLWIQAGRIELIPFIHHSNFPFAVDNLYIWGLQWGGESGAKAFSLAFYALGLAVLFGMARSLYGRRAGWWAALVFGTMPVVLWEAGTAYIDVANGLYAGLGIAFAALWLRSPDERRYVWLAGISVGMAIGSKYTGLQVLAAVGVLLVGGGVALRQGVPGLRAGVTVGVVALAVGGGWYAKNQAWVDNPVYPFFYERLGGRFWDQRRADIYRNEQQTFGVGRTESGRDPLQIGHAVLGLAYQPGRYVNPGQTLGLGTPLGAVGVSVIAAILVWCFAGRLGRFEGGVLAAVGFSLILWFFLSQQSRYIVSLGVPVAILAGGAVVRTREGSVLAVAAALQAAYSLFLVNLLLTQDQLVAVVGKESRDEFLARRVPFFVPAQSINELGAGSRVALYDEVFGYFLEVPYVWANPGHSTLIPYDDFQDGVAYARWMRENGYSHAYLSLAPLVRPRDQAARWLSAAGLADGPGPYEGEERAALMTSFEQRYLVLLAEAILAGEARPVEGFRSGLLVAF
jgi:hypothetical protein